MRAYRRNRTTGSLLATLTAALLAMIVYSVASNGTPAANAEGASDSQHGELVYVPIYSSVFYENGKQTLELAATLSIHNVNPDREITITRADYYNTDGRLIKRYADKPLVLGALQTTNVVIDMANKSGGTGANFLVEWQAKEDVASPLIEAVMVNATSNLGIAFTTIGKVVRKTPAVARSAH
jgi:hypothetical protein